MHVVPLYSPMLSLHLGYPSKRSNHQHRGLQAYLRQRCYHLTPYWSLPFLPTATWEPAMPDLVTLLKRNSLILLLKSFWGPKIPREKDCCDHLMRTIPADLCRWTEEHPNPQSTHSLIVVSLGKPFEHRSSCCMQCGI